MRASAVAGLVLANANDDLLKKLTSHRSMASVPFGARYRLIDFSLSNLVNAGITSVGIITKENYRSLMDHVSSGVYWDLDRKSGGLYLLPPYSSKGAKRYTGTIDALNGANEYITHCKSDYIVICNADVLANVDISAAIKAHISKKADITVVYHNGKVMPHNGETMVLSLDGDNRINEVELDCADGAEAAFSIGITVIGKELLTELIEEAHGNDLVSFNRDVLAKRFKQLQVYGYEHKDYVAFMSSTDSYYCTNMDLLKSEVRHQLFNKERPIYTKIRDDMPTRYGTKAQVKNCYIADGCVINGTVKNSILFRGVTVEKGAVVENCILMQETKVGEDAQLDNVIADKNAVISEKIVLKGTNDKHVFLEKNETL